MKMSQPALLHLLLVLLATSCLLPSLTDARNDPHGNRLTNTPTMEEDTDDIGGDGEGEGDSTTSGHYGSYGTKGEVQPKAKCRHNYHERTETAINRQINLFLHVGYVYSSMAHHFGSCDVALPGFEKFFQQMADEQQVRAATLTKYQSIRGGVAMLLPVSAPATTNWGSGLEAMERALELEKTVNQALLELHLVAQQHEDTHASTYIQTSFLNPQVEKLFTLSQYVTSLERVGPGLGEYIFDKMPQN